VYSNDWHGWKALAVAKAKQHSLEECVAAYTNAVRLGDEDDYQWLGAAALLIGRVDILRDLVVPRLLVLKDSAKGTSRLDMVQVLLGYSLLDKRQDIFVRSFKGISDADIMTRGDDFKRAFRAGCGQFHPKELESLCREVREAEESATPSDKK
jgi:hypothetical protein